MLTTAQVKAKEKGDGVSEYQGVIVKVWDYKSGDNEYGPWSFQDVVVKDAAAEEISIKLAKRVPIPEHATAVYVKAGEKKGKAAGTEVEEYKDTKRISTNGYADIRVLIGVEWKALDKIKIPEKKKEEAAGSGPDASKLPPVGGASGPGTSPGTTGPGSAEPVKDAAASEPKKETTGPQSVPEQEKVQGNPLKGKDRADLRTRVFNTAMMAIYPLMKNALKLSEDGKSHVPMYNKQQIQEEIDDYFREGCSKVFEQDKEIPF